jgi:HD-like signal output (HDOD) protein
VRAMSHLGALPISLGRLAAVTGAPEFDFGEIVDVVGHDMVLTTGVLRAANSASSATAARVESVRDAVVRLGAARTLAAAMLTIVGGRFQQQLLAYSHDPGELWRHSCAASIAADLVRTTAPIRLPASVGTTGLVHDIGKLVLEAVLTERSDTTAYAGVFAGRFGTELCAVERETFRIDHAEAGAIVAAYWELPPAIVEAIRGHHHAVDDPVAVAIGLADAIAHAVTHDGTQDELHALRLARVIGISLDDIPSLVDRASSQLALLADHYPPDTDR